MENFFEFFFFVAFEAFIAIDSEIFYSFNELLPSESLIKRSQFISRGVYLNLKLKFLFFPMLCFPICQIFLQSRMIYQLYTVLV